MNQIKFSLPPPAEWTNVPIGALPTDVEAFAKLTAEQKNDLSIGAAGGLHGYRTFARTNPTPSARLMLTGQHLQRLGCDIVFKFSNKQNDQGAALEPGVAIVKIGADDLALAKHLRGQERSQWAHGRISDRIGALGLLRSTLFDPDDCRDAAFREYCAPVTNENPDLLPRAFMTSMLVRHIRTDTDLIIDDDRTDDEVRADHGLYEIMRGQGLKPFGYSELTELALRSSNLRNIGISPVAEL